MLTTNDIADFFPAAIEETLERLGRNILTARLRRRLLRAESAERVGVSRFVVADVAIDLGALWALGLLGDVREVADPDRDEEGKTLERARGPSRARSRRVLSDDL